MKIIFHVSALNVPEHLHCHIKNHFCSLLLFFFFRDQSLTDLMPLYKTMKKATFSDSEDEVCLYIYNMLLFTF